MPQVADARSLRWVIARKKHPVKLTALLYLREALAKQWYEDCPYFIQVAKEFGALDVEVEELLEDGRRMPR